MSDEPPAPADPEPLWALESIPPHLRHRLDALNGAAISQTASAYEGFGSFHSENVEDLIAREAATYRPPQLPDFAKRVLGQSELLKMSLINENNGSEEKSDHKNRRQEVNIENGVIQQCEFGLPFRQEHFSITAEAVFINHGAFGGSLRGALAIKHRYEELMEREVVEFMDRDLLPLIVYSVRRLAEFFKADPQQVVLVQNATYALNCAMRLIEKDDVVAFLDTEYLSVYKMMYFQCKDVGADFHEIALSKYLHDTKVMGDDDALTNVICQNLPNGCTTVIIDYVTSTSALCFPLFTHIIPALRRHGVIKIIVDGAHAPLQIDLNFNNLPVEARPSVFVGNLHKWFSVSKSVGFMWVHERLVDSIRSVVLSHGAGDGLLSEFIWDGTRDYGAYLCIPAVIDFWRAQGLDRVREHCSKLLKGAAGMLTKSFGTRPVARHAPFMSLVELPKELQVPRVTAKYIQDLLHDVYKVEVPVKRVEGRFYVRISVFVYNTPSDYSYLREAILDIARKWVRLEKQMDFQKYEAGMTTDSLQLPCDKRIREEGGCGVSALDPGLKRRKSSKF
ncbi:hypothetical protein LSM04_000840 [Trypanosoma melophagium]|uniref:uncharacterized protein n=1 Tax=Trypanosoma melophagium TaxID=715481 RepID=UPI00351A92BC|nr:hypothetical protein LSM04_000840 [Trypanosoma melophagium]